MTSFQVRPANMFSLYFLHSTYDEWAVSDACYIADAAFASRCALTIFSPQATAIFGDGAVMHVAGEAIDAYGAAQFGGMYTTLLRDTPINPGPQVCFVLADITQLPAVFKLSHPEE